MFRESVHSLRCPKYAPNFHRSLHSPLVRAGLLQVSPILVVDGFHLALVELLEGDDAVAVAVHLLRRAAVGRYPLPLKWFIGWGKDGKSWGKC